jgi:hypothetical protein
LVSKIIDFLVIALSFIRTKRKEEIVSPTGRMEITLVNPRKSEIAPRKSITISNKLNTI